jgi:hypothetical protein
MRGRQGGCIVRYTVTRHADKVLKEREIPIEWVERSLDTPEWREPDPADAALERLYRRIPEREGRVLRVVVNRTVSKLHENVPYWNSLEMSPWLHRSTLTYI